jgi:cytochrome c oxidase assembly factor CtaG
MTQHVIRLTVAAPLLAIGRPIPTLFWALPPGPRRGVTHVWRRTVRLHGRHVVGWVAVAVLVQGAVMWAWHVPIAYEAALRHPPLHLLEHTTFLLTASVAWSVAAAGRRFRGAAAVAALLGSVPGAVLGAAMVLSPRPWYSSYVTGTVGSALVDQQVAGVVMWAFGGMAVVITGAAFFASWLGHEPAPAVHPGPRTVAAT